MDSSLNLLGVTALFGSDVAKGAIRYINANQNRCATSLFVVPGLYSISSQMLRRSDAFVAHVLSPGSRENVRKIVGFESSNAYKYIGMRSGTHASVQNALCEGWLNRLLKSAHGRRSRLFREGGRPTAVHSVLLNKSSPGEIIKCDDSEKSHMAASVVLQLGALVAAGLMVKTKSIVGMSLVAANMLSNLMINVVVTRDEYKTPGMNPSPGVPAGHSIITDQKQNNVCVVMGNETDVQNFMQHQVDVKLNAKQAHVAVSLFGSLTSVATVLLMPALSHEAKLLFAAQLIIGLLSGAVFSSRDGDAMLEKLAKKYYFEQGIGTPTTSTLYSNRSTAIAAAVIETRGRAENIGPMVPVFDDQGNWELYTKLLNDIIGSDKTSQIMDCRSYGDAVGTMCALYPDSAGKLYKKNSAFSKRLVADVLEALVQRHKGRSTWPAV